MRRHCACGTELEVERIGKAPGRLVGWCPSCSLVHLPESDSAAPLRLVADYPRSSSERTEQ